MKKVSRYTIFSRIKDSPDYFIMNVLSGSADILTAAEYSLLQQGKVVDHPDFIEKGYVVEEEKEEKLFRDEYFRFCEQRDQEEIQLFFVPSYACNFHCSYCYQAIYSVKHLGQTTIGAHHSAEPHLSQTMIGAHHSAEPGSKLTHEIMDAFFLYVEREFVNRKKYITLFGGEPLLPSPRHKEMIDYFIVQCKKRGLDISVVTNGYNVKDYLPVLQKAVIREIQVTLDGTENHHNKRRPLKNGERTFNTIVQGIDAVLAAKIHLNLRVVLDRENTGNLAEFSRFAKEKGWTSNPYFKTQLGRNYELHSCTQNPDSLFSRLELHRELYNLIKRNPEILEFHTPQFSISRSLFENGTLPGPIFDDCPGAKYEWAFDYTGRIYACTATAGKAGEELGTFYPEITKYEDKIMCWEDRDITTIPGCKECSIQLICGGGCAALAKNKNRTLLSGDCRPVKEILELGMGLYMDKH